MPRVVLVKGLAYDLDKRETCAECKALVALNEPKLRVAAKLSLGPPELIHARCEEDFRARLVRRDRLVAQGLTDLLRLIGD